MTREEFTEVLDQKGYSYTIKNGSVVVTHRGYVYLYNLKTLPKGVAFENGGYVYLDSLTTLPEGVVFENDGGVNLDSLTTLPEGVMFENGGYVYLYNLKTLPEGVAFENGGTVYLGNLTGEHKYRSESRQFQTIDGYTMLIERSRSHGGHTVHTARYFGGGDIAKLRKCYVAQSGDTYAHGKTVKSAVDDLTYKMAERADKDEIARKVVQSQKVTLADFRALTGACREGTREHLSQQGIDLDAIEEMSLTDALKAMAGTSFGDTFKDFVEAAQ